MISYLCCEGCDNREERECGRRERWLGRVRRGRPGPGPARGDRLHSAARPLAHAAAARAQGGGGCVHRRQNASRLLLSIATPGKNIVYHSAAGRDSYEKSQKRSFITRVKLQQKFYPSRNPVRNNLSGSDLFLAH